MSQSDRIARHISKVAEDPAYGEVLWRMRSDDGRVDLTHGDPGRPFFIASATKLYVTAILAQLRDEARLDWDAPVAGYLPDLDLTGLLVVAGQDLSDRLTVRAVMAHTAGLADYFEDRRPDGSSTFARLLHEDFGWDVRDVITWTKGMHPATPGEGHYSDTGYQLLGALIERLDERAFAESVQARIARPLGLDDTYCFTGGTIERYDDVAALRFGDSPLRIPNAMASAQADGGIVSTLADGLTFLDAFFAGRLFPSALHDQIQTGWHRIFFPLEYGTGIMRLRMSPLMTGLRRVPVLVGHSGASGTVMYRCPQRGLSIVGTLNQAKHRSMPVQLMIRTVLSAGG